MHHHYRDIIDRIDERPKWWDEDGVPRYCEFGPDEGAHIYANEIALLEIRCQNCHTHFKVAISNTPGNFGPKGFHWSPNEMENALRKGNGLHYGDPPNAGCCASGPTMNSEPIRVLEFWRRGLNDARVPECEVELEEAQWGDPR